MDHAKVEAIVNWKPPRSATEVKSFLGLAKLLRKGMRFEWNDKCQAIFEQLKEMLVEAPVLTQPTPGKEYVMYSDASKNGLVCVLMQDNRVVVYSSRQLKPYE